MQQNEVEVIGALLEQANMKLQEAGVVMRSRFVNGVQEYEYLVPLIDGRHVSFRSRVRPTVEVGAGKVGKKIKAGLKKVAKSKAFSKLLKAGAAIASVVPGGQALGAGLAVASKAKDIAAKAAKKGKKAVKAVKGAVKGTKALTAGKGAAKGKLAAPKVTPTKLAAPRTALAKTSATPAVVPTNKGELVKLPNGRQALVQWVN